MQHGTVFVFSLNINCIDSRRGSNFALNTVFLKTTKVRVPSINKKERELIFLNTQIQGKEH